MIQIALIITTSLAIMVAALLNYAPNYKKVVNSDFMRRSYDYANYRAMEEAQLKYRAGSLKTNGDKTTLLSVPDCLYSVAGDTKCLKITGKVKYDGVMTVTLTENSAALK